jgi:pilus assembly protein CpaE
MNAHTNMAFKSSRSASAATPEMVPEAPVMRPEPTAATSVLMISTSAVVLEHFANMTGAADGTVVTSRNGTLAGVLEEDGIHAFDHDVVVFERTEGDEGQMEALHQIASVWAGRTRFMVLTADNLSLAQARALIDAGVEEVIPLSTVLPQPVAAAPALAPQEDSSAEKGLQGRIVVVAKTRGGVGATTTAVNLAQALLTEPAKGRKAAKTNRVAIVDLDIQNGAVGSFLDVSDGGGVIELLRAGEVPDTTVLRRAMVAHPHGLSVFPAPTEFAPVDAMTAAMLDAMLVNLRSRFDYVVVDLPTAILPTLSVLLAKADRLLMVTDTAVTSIRQASRLLSLITEDHFTLPVEVVVTKQAKPMRLSTSLKEAVAVLGRPFAHWIPQDDRSARMAIDLGKPAAVIAARSAMTKAYRRLADDLIASHSSANTKDS